VKKKKLGNAETMYVSERKSATKKRGPKDGSEGKVGRPTNEAGAGREKGCGVTERREVGGKEAEQGGDTKRQSLRTRIREKISEKVRWGERCTRGIA